jgi:hypothetical protein
MSVISLTDISSVYTPTSDGPFSLSRYYINNKSVLPCIQNISIPRSGAISFGNFSNALTNADAIFEVPGTYTWKVPPTVSTVSMVCVGGGGGGGCGTTVAGNAYGSGGGGALMYKNNVSVTPGQTLTVTVGVGGTGGNMSSRSGNNGGDSFVATNQGTVLCRAKGGTGGSTTAGTGGRYSESIGDGGGSGGDGSFNTNFAAGGGGAGGYCGSGSHFIFTTPSNISSVYGIPCSTGGGSSGGANENRTLGGGGGGVSIYGGTSPYDNLMSNIIGYLPLDSNTIDVCGNYSLVSCNVTYSSTQRGVMLTNGHMSVSNITPYSGTVGSANVYAYTTTAPILNIANGFSVSLWIRYDSFGTASAGDIINFYDGLSNMFYIRCRPNVSAPPNSIAVGITNNVNVDIVVNGSQPIAGQFAHVATSMTSSNISVYMNGIKHTYSLVNITPAFNRIQHFYIGSSYLRNRGINGAIDNVLIWNRTITDNEASYLYQSRQFGSYIPMLPRLSNMVGYFAFDNEIADKLSRYTTSNVNTTYNTTVNMFGVACLSCANATPGGAPTSYITTTVAPTIDVASTGISVALWVHPTAVPAGTNGSRIITFSAGSTELFSISIGPPSNTPPTPYSINLFNGSTTSTLFTVTAQVNIWTHLVGMYNPVSRQIVLYVNGKRYSTSMTNNAVTTVDQLFIGTLSSSTRAYSGYVDDLRIFNTVLGDHEVQSIFQYRGWAQPGLLYKLMSYFEFDSTVTDSTNNYTMTNTGCTFSTTDIVTSSFDAASLVITNVTNSATANSATQYVASSVAPTLILSEGITFSVWVKISSLPASTANIITYHDTTYTWFALAASSTNIMFNARNSTSVFTSLAGSTVVTGTWQHMTCVYDASGSQLRLYVNGSLVATQTSFSTTATTISSLCIGANHAIANGFSGKLDDLRSWNTVLSDIDIARMYTMSVRYTNNACGILYGLIGAFTFDGNIIDETDRYLMTNTGCTFNTTDKKTGTSALVIANTTVASSTANTTTVYALSSRSYPIYMGSGFSLSCWVKPTTLTTTGFSSIIVEFGDSAMLIPATILYVNTSSRSYALSFSVATEFGGTLSTVIAKQPTILNTWHHVVAVADPFNCVLKIYVNGQLSINSYCPTMFVTLKHIQLGGRITNRSRAFAGLLDDLKIWNRPLDDNECAYLYYDRTHGFGGANAPDAGLNGSINPSNIICYVPFDGNANDEQNNYTSVTFGQVYYNSVPAIANFAINLMNPTPGSLSTQASSFVALTSTSVFTSLPYTFSIWAYFTGTMATSSQITILSTTNVMILHDPTAGLHVQYVDGATTNTPSFTGSVLTTSTWYHIAVILTASSMTLFLNGAQVSMVNISISNLSLSPLYLGRDLNTMRAFQGYIDDFKIINANVGSNNIYRMFARVDGGKYGGGGGAVNTLQTYQAGGNGGHGAVRIAWNNTSSRMFPVSDAVTPYKPIGGRVFTTIGLEYWRVPENVAYITIICVGGGGGGDAGIGTGAGGGSGGGGGLAYENNILVTPGETLIITVGAGGSGGVRNGAVPATSGGASSVLRDNGTILCSAGGGGAGTSTQGGAGGVIVVGDGGGAGGNGTRSTSSGSGGGGSGGYSGNGGQGSTTATGNSGAGGAGGSGGVVSGVAGSGGGGVSVYGLGLNGNAGTGGGAGQGGSGGGSGGNGLGTNNAGNGGLYGGGGASPSDTGTTAAIGGNGGQGIVRIIWSDGRMFPNTNVATDSIAI